MTVNVKHCPKCRHQIAHYATHCCHCGWTPGPRNMWFLVLAAVIGLGILGYTMFNDYNLAPDKTPDQRVIRNK